MATKPPPRKPPSIPRSKPKAASVSHTPKTFNITPWTGTDEGEKILIYGKSGIGKTTLASMAPKPVFIGVDDGGRRIRNPLTGEPVDSINGIENFQDIRDALRQKGLFEDYSSVVIDTVTKVEELVTHHILETVTKDGKRMPTFRHFGWDGERHMLDQYRLLLTDLDPHIRAGRNVILLAQLSQITVANAEGADYLEDGPKLQHRKDCSVRTELVEWADHVLRVGYLEFVVDKESAKSRVGKVRTNDATRAVFTGGAQHFIAKSRPVMYNRETPYRIPAVIPFMDETDQSLWAYLFDGAVEDTD